MAKYDMDFVANFMENTTVKNRSTYVELMNDCIVAQFFFIETMRTMLLLLLLLTAGCGRNAYVYVKIRSPILYKSLFTKLVVAKIRKTTYFIRLLYFLTIRKPWFSPRSDDPDPPKVCQRLSPRLNF